MFSLLLFIGVIYLAWIYYLKYSNQYGTHDSFSDFILSDQELEQIDLLFIDIKDTSQKYSYDPLIINIEVEQTKEQLNYNILFGSTMMGIHKICDEMFSPQITNNAPIHDCADPEHYHLKSKNESFNLNINLKGNLWMSIYYHPHDGIIIQKFGKYQSYIELKKVKNMNYKFNLRLDDSGMHFHSDHTYIKEFYKNITSKRITYKYKKKTVAVIEYEGS